jgi:S1-C subfamily serine protease
MVGVLLALMLWTDWTATAKKTNASIVYVESETSKCTGFVIHDAWKNDTDLILTAQHCDGKQLFADYVSARVIFKHQKNDLMIVEVADTGRPALVIAAKNPAIGEEVGSYGYGYALERPMFRLAHVSDDEAVLPDIEGGPFVMIDAGYVSGQSGGAVVNAAGEVVSIVQRASGLVGIGVGAQTIRAKVSRFLPKP